MTTIGQVRVPHPIMVLHGGGVALACGLDGQVYAEQLHGLFAADTRVLSTYRLSINGQPWRLLGRSREGQGTAHWQFLNPPVHGVLGEIPQGQLLLTVRRRVDRALHDDLRLHAFVRREVRVRLAIQLDADFADIFEVRERRLPPRLHVRRDPEICGGRLIYDHRGFRRGLHVGCQSTGAPPVYAGALVVFTLALAPGAEWCCCLDAAPEVDGEVLRLTGDPHDVEPDPVPGGGPTLQAPPLLEGSFERGRRDLHSLAVPGAGRPPYVAAGVPWFLTLFGRDSLMAALMIGLDGTWAAEGALAALGERQASVRDDWRDAEPGKLPHEIRRGELAWSNRIPHAAYYGTHDAQSLYCLALWHAWRWRGERRVLAEHLETARRALRWCEEWGDRDQDGFQEYETRSPGGYYNQGWKDAGDAIVDADGALAPLPLATVELQGYMFAASLAMAELFEAGGDPVEAARLRRAAAVLRERVERTYWMEGEGFYAMALDGRKRIVPSISSNPGHLLWSGLPAPARAEAVGRRLMQPDLFTGWGLRTLSAAHPSYNPLSYQLGSVWPHDTALAAAGLWRYEQFEAADRLLQAILEAACVFEAERLPELFCGLDRSHGLPVPYEEANSPQAWAAAVPLLCAQLFLGIVPDAPHGRCFLSPRLPPWLPALKIRGLSIGQGTLDVVLARRRDETVIEELNAKDLTVVEARVEAPLWGTPPLLSSMTGSGDREADVR